MLKKKLIVFGVLTALILSVLGGFLFKSKPEIKDQPSIKDIFRNSIPSVDFTIYYPATIPLNYSVNTDSIRAQHDLFNFSIKTSGQNDIIVTEQKLPPTMEEVTKTKEFVTDIGQAYIADLNGKVTGFIRTKGTLVIISNADKSQSTQLEELLINFALVK